MTSESDDSAGAGRKPPPVKSRFTPGQSGNPRGKRPGTVSRKRLTRKVALQIYRVPIDGKIESRSLLELVVLKVRGMALNVKPGAGAMLELIENQLRPPEQVNAKYLVTPIGLKAEEWKAQAAAHNALHLKEPGADEPEYYNALAQRPTNTVNMP
jgi:hypothetical protein